MEYIKKYWWIGAIILGLILIYFLFSKKKGGKNSNLAKCIADSGAKFYGTSTCSHCNSQKAKFGADAKYLPYIECQNNYDCTDAGITSYPTWIFADGQRMAGGLEVSEIAQLAGCKV